MRHYHGEALGNAGGAKPFDGDMGPSGSIIPFPREVVDDGDLARADLEEVVASWMEFGEDADGDPGGFYRAAELLIASCRVLEAARVSLTGEEIREMIEPVRRIIGRSPLVHRLQSWPRGYPGDFETVEYLIEGKNRSPEGTLEHYCESFALNSPPVQQHRNKIQEQARLIVEACIPRERRARILSLGCGGCADLRLAAKAVAPSNPEIVLLDVDEDALEFARQSLPDLEENCSFVHGNVVRLIRNVLSDPYDLVLAGGLFDYLPDRAITFILKALWEKGLRRGGRIFFTNYGQEDPQRTWRSYMVSWDLLERSEEDLRELCRTAGIPDECVTIKRDTTGLTHLVEIRKV